MTASPADEIARLVRQWYEDHRETWLERFSRNADAADDFMLALVAEVKQVTLQVTPPMTVRLAQPKDAPAVTLANVAAIGRKTKRRRKAKRTAGGKKTT